MKRNRGLSLLETIIASFIFLTVVLGLMGVWSTHSRAIGKARGTLIANELGEKVMEKCLAARFQMIPRLDGKVDLVEVEFVIKGEAITNTFKSTIEVIDLSPQIRDVIVLVEWEDTTGPQRIELHSQVHSSA